MNYIFIKCEDFVNCLITTLDDPKILIKDRPNRDILTISTVRTVFCFLVEVN